MVLPNIKNNPRIKKLRTILNKNQRQNMISVGFTRSTPPLSKAIFFSCSQATGEAKEENSGIPQSLASNYIINSMLICELAFAMGLLGVNADLRSPSPLLYVFRLFRIV